MNLTTCGMQTLATQQIRKKNRIEKHCNNSLRDCTEYDMIIYSFIGKVKRDGHAGNENT